jgi:Tfp pilus assembly protein PilO
MVLSYIIILGILYLVIFAPQRKLLRRYINEKEEIEYAYLKATSSPAFLKSIDETMEISMEETSTGKKTKEEKLYYKWKVKITGGFPDIVSFINDMEQNEKFLIVKDITVNRTRIVDDISVVYEMLVLGVKKEALSEQK